MPIIFYLDQSSIIPLKILLFKICSNLQNLNIIIILNVIYYNNISCIVLYPLTIVNCS